MSGIKEVMNKAKLAKKARKSDKPKDNDKKVAKNSWHDKDQDSDKY